MGTTRHLNLSDERPSNRAEALVLRESTGLTFEWSIGPVKGKGSATTETHPTSPSAIGIGMLLLALGSSLPGVLLTLANQAIHAPAVLIAVAAILLFLVVFATGALLILRGGPALRPAADPAALPDEDPSAGRTTA
ncbi:hypothetical protein ACFVTP_06365 [Streptomyces celluloflavus]|uniref:hypothetical protein n=1 Tax=Streptomyces celluloflavus TaxID=58344 RepID=UPI0036DBF478